MSRLRHRLSSLTRQFSSSSSPFSFSSSKVPLIYEAPEGTSVVPLQLYSWGRGSSGQLGGGIEEIRIYPAPVANLLLPEAFSISPTPGKLRENPRVSSSTAFFSDLVIEVGISCGLFHSSLLVGGNLWIWGKGDGGRLGCGHENPVFEPTLNPNLDGVSCIALGGLHSVALTSAGQVFTWCVWAFYLDNQTPHNCSFCCLKFLHTEI